MQTEIKAPAIRYHGGKFRLAKWITGFFPPHRCYVEPYGGAASVLLRKPRSHAEVYNDLDGEIVNLFRVLRDPLDNHRLRTLCALTPYSRDEFNLAYEPTENRIEKARRLVVRATMGFGSAAATADNKTGFRSDTKREYSTAQQIWASYPDNLAAIGERLISVLIENRPALQVINDHDSEKTLHYIDPPYLPQTRHRWRRTGYAYRFEMTEQEHIELLEPVGKVKGMVIISGYDSELYNDILTGWRKETKIAQVSAGTGGTSKRTECLWISPNCKEQERAA
ncbi:DNA adenine methylase [Serratia aquatilis]|uniref:DNA adenine methylase n=1 Tax=Serratia aquatilis TaxID=1737515 RepID=A0ABV6EEL1_9GAMM